MIPSLAERVAALDSSAVSDALDGMRLRGALTSLRALSITRRISGRVVTVQLAAAQDHASPRHLCTAAVDASGPGDVIVVAHNGRLDVAGWGGILSLGATVRKVEGVVIDGACRDLDESRELGFAVYGRAAVPVTARGRIVETAWNVPVQIDGLSVSPGDIVIADGSGVVFIPQVQAEEIVTIAEQVAGRERAISDSVRRGASMVEAMGLKYEAMLQRNHDQD